MGLHILYNQCSAVKAGIPGTQLPLATKMLLEVLSTGDGTTDSSDKVDTKSSPKQFPSSDTECLV